MVDQLNYDTESTSSSYVAPISYKNSESTVPNGTTTDDIPTSVEIPPEQIAARSPVSTLEAAETIVTSLADAANDPAQPISRRNHRLRAKLTFIVLAEKLPNEPPVVTPQTIDPNIGGSFGSLLFNLQSVFTDPNSQFSSTLRDVMSKLPIAKAVQNQELPTSLDVVKKFMGPALQSIMGNARDVQVGVESIPEEYRYLGGAAANAVKRFVETRGVHSENTKNTGSKSRGFKKFLDTAVNVGKKAIGVVKTVQEVASTVQEVC